MKWSLFLNLLVGIVFCCELWMDFGIILDEKIVRKVKIIYIIRLVAASLVFLFILWFIYNSFSITGINLNKGQLIGGWR